MANPEHLEILKEGVDVWNKWRLAQRHIPPDLVGVQLRSTNLPNADFSYADLSFADLNSADLRSASFNHGNLSYADLKAGLNDAEFGNTVIADVDLSQVKGLDTSRHNFRSRLGA